MDNTLKHNSDVLTALQNTSDSCFFGDKAVFNGIKELFTHPVIWLQQVLNYIWVKDQINALEDSEYSDQHIEKIVSNLKLGVSSIKYSVVFMFFALLLFYLFRASKSVNEVKLYKDRCFTALYLVVWGCILLCGYECYDIPEQIDYLLFIETLIFSLFIACLLFLVISAFIVTWPRLLPISSIIIYLLPKIGDKAINKDLYYILFVLVLLNCTLAHMFRNEKTYSLYFVEFVDALNVVSRNAVKLFSGLFLSLSLHYLQLSSVYCIWNYHKQNKYTYFLLIFLFAWSYFSVSYFNRLFTTLLFKSALFNEKSTSNINLIALLNKTLTSFNLISFYSFVAALFQTFLFSVSSVAFMFYNSGSTLVRFLSYPFYFLGWLLKLIMTSLDINASVSLLNLGCLGDDQYFTSGYPPKNNNKFIERLGNYFDSFWALQNICNVTISAIFCYNFSFIVDYYPAYRFPLFIALNMLFYFINSFYTIYRLNCFMKEDKFKHSQEHLAILNEGDDSVDKGYSIVFNIDDNEISTTNEGGPINTDYKESCNSPVNYTSVNQLLQDNFNNTPISSNHLQPMGLELLGGNDALIDGVNVANASSSLIDKLDEVLVIENEEILNNLENTEPAKNIISDNDTTNNSRQNTAVGSSCNTDVASNAIEVFPVLDTKTVNSFDMISPAYIDANSTEKITENLLPQTSLKQQGNDKTGSSKPKRDYSIKDAKPPHNINWYVYESLASPSIVADVDKVVSHLGENEFKKNFIDDINESINLAEKDVNVIHPLEVFDEKLLEKEKIAPATEENIYKHNSKPLKFNGTIDICKNDKASAKIQEIANLSFNEYTNPINNSYTPINNRRNSIVPQPLSNGDSLSTDIKVSPYNKQGRIKHNVKITPRIFNTYPKIANNPPVSDHVAKEVIPPTTRLVSLKEIIGEPTLKKPESHIAPKDSTVDSKIPVVTDEQIAKLYNTHQNYLKYNPSGLETVYEEEEKASSDEDREMEQYLKNLIYNQTYWPNAAAGSTSEAPVTRPRRNRGKNARKRDAEQLAKKQLEKNTTAVAETEKAAKEFSTVPGGTSESKKLNSNVEEDLPRKIAKARAKGKKSRPLSEQKAKQYAEELELRRASNRKRGYTEDPIESKGQREFPIPVTVQDKDVFVFTGKIYNEQDMPTKEYVDYGKLLNDFF